MPNCWAGSAKPTNFALEGCLVEKILTPLRIALAEQSHQVAAGMQAKWTRLASQLHAGFFRRAAAFAVIAVMAAGHQIFPSRFPGAGARNHVIERQLRRRHGAMAVLA